MCLLFVGLITGIVIIVWSTINWKLGSQFSVLGGFGISVTSVCLSAMIYVIYPPYLLPNFVDSGVVVSKTVEDNHFYLRVKNDKNKTEQYGVDKSVYDSTEIGENVKFDKTMMYVK